MVRPFRVSKVEYTRWNSSLITLAGLGGILKDVCRTKLILQAYAVFQMLTTALERQQIFQPFGDLASNLTSLKETASNSDTSVVVFFRWCFGFLWLFLSQLFTYM